MTAPHDGRQRSGPPRSAEEQDQDWDRALLALPEATYFHTRAWAHLVTAVFPQCRDLSRIWKDPVTGCEHRVPLFLWRRTPLFTTVHSSFPFLYGGPLPATAPDGSPVLARFADDIARRDRSVRITGNPFARLPSVSPEPSQDDAARQEHGYRVQTETTHLRAVPESDEAFWDGELTPARRNDVRRLGKKGVTIETTGASTDVDAVYGLYRASFERWGGRPAFVHPPEFYQALARDPAVRFTVARHEGRVLGGTFAVRWNRKVHYLAGYFDSEARSLRPNVLLQIDSIRAAIADGFAWYDFLPSGGHPAVEQFKEGFGGQRAPFPVWERQGRWHRWKERWRGRRSP